MKSISFFTLACVGSSTEVAGLLQMVRRNTGRLQKLSLFAKDKSFYTNLETKKEEWNASLYKTHHSFVWENGSSLVEILNPKRGELILDVGCGTGELTNMIADRGAFCIGFDKDLKMLESAQEQYPHIQFFQSDVQDFSFDDGPVDAIFSNAALHWIKNASSAVASMSRALKPGGRFVVEFGGRGNVQLIVNATLEALDLPSSENPWYFPSIAEYSSLLEEHGIEVLYASLIDRSTILNDGAEGLSNWLRMFAGCLLRDLSNQEVDSVIRKINDTLRPTLFDSVQWTADYRRIRIVGRKKLLTELRS